FSSPSYVERHVAPSAKRLESCFCRLHQILNLTLDQTIERDREFPYAKPCRVPYGIRDRTGRPGDPDFAHALDTERVDVRIAFGDKDGFDRGYVGVHWNVVLAQIGVHRASRARINDGLLMKCKRYAPNHAAAELAAHHPRIDDPPRREGAHHPGHAHR